MTKSMMVVVPPASPAAVPVKKSSDVTVPMKGKFMCVWVSIPPGITYRPPASITVAPTGTGKFSPTAAIMSPSISTSARKARSALTTVPPRISVVILSPLCLRLRRLLHVRHGLALHHDAVDDGGDGHAHEPGVGVDGFKAFGHAGKRRGKGRIQKTGDIRQHGNDKGDQRCHVPAIAI